MRYSCEQCALFFSPVVYAVSLICLAAGGARSNSFQFTIVGDRTGEAQPGVYEQVWQEVAKEKPKFVLSVGDTIQGLTTGRR